MEFKKEDLMRALTKQKEQIEAEKNSRAKVETECKRLAEELNLAHERISQFAELASKLETLEDERMTLFARLKETEAKENDVARRSEVERRRWENEKIQLQEQLSTASQGLAQLDQVRKAMQAEFQASISEKEEEVRNLTTLLRDLSEKLEGEVASRQAQQHTELGAEAKSNDIERSEKLEQELSKSYEKLATLSAKLDEVEKSLCDSMEQNALMQRENADLLRQLGDSGQELSRGREKHSEMESQVANLARDLQESLRDREQLHATVSDTQLSLDVAQNHLGTLEADLKITAATALNATQLQTALDAALKRVADLESEIERSDSSAQIDALRHALEAAQTRIITVEDELSRTKADAEHSSEMAKTVLEGAKTKIASLESDLDKALAGTKELERGLSEQQSTVIAARESEISRAQADLVEALRANAALRAELSSALERLTLCEGRVEQAEALAAEVFELKAELQATRNKAEMLESELDRVHQESQNAEELMRVQRDREEDRRSMAAMQTDLDLAREELSSKDIRERELLEQIRVLEERPPGPSRDDLQQELDHSAARIRVLEEELVDAVNDDSKEKEIRDAHDRVAQLEATVQTLQEQLVQAQQEEREPASISGPSSQTLELSQLSDKQSSPLTEDNSAHLTAAQLQDEKERARIAQDDADALRVRVKELEDQLVQSPPLPAILESDGNQFRSLQRQVASDQDVIADLRLQLSTWQYGSGDAPDSQATDVLQQRIRGLEYEIAELRAKPSVPERSTSVEIVAESRRQLEEATRAARALEEELRAARAEASAASGRFDALLSGEPGPWVQHARDDDMPTPRHLTLESPVIQTILQAWNPENKNVGFFNKWCSHILSGKDVESGFQKGVELTRCTPIVKDGLLSLVVPLLRGRQDVDIAVYTRERLQVYHDIRLKVVRAQSGASDSS